MATLFLSNLRLKTKDDDLFVRLFREHKTPIINKLILFESNMSETKNFVPPKNLLQPEPYSGFVYLGGLRRVAMGSNTIGEGLDLSVFLSGGKSSIVKGREVFPIEKIYLRTESDNVYCLRYNPKKQTGEIMNGKTGEETPIRVTTGQDNHSLTIKIGEAFKYRNLETTGITEYVAVGSTPIEDTEVYNLSPGIESSIVKDFKNLLEKSTQQKSLPKTSSSPSPTGRS